jgi:nitric oxide reductase large subunit
VIGAKKAQPKESKLALPAVILINVVLWAMVVIGIWGAVQQIPSVGRYPIA